MVANEQTQVELFLAAATGGVRRSFEQWNVPLSTVWVVRYCLDWFRVSQDLLVRSITLVGGPHHFNCYMSAWVGDGDVEAREVANLGKFWWGASDVRGELAVQLLIHSIISEYM